MTKYLKGKFFSYCPPPKKHNFISHNSSVPQVPVTQSRNIIPPEGLKKEKEKKGITNNKLDEAGLFSTAASEIISRALMRLQAVVVVAEDA